MASTELETFARNGVEVQEAADSQLATQDWPTLEEAALTLQTSVRTMWRHIERGDVEVKKRPVPGRKPANVVNPRDIDKLRPQPFVMPAVPAEKKPVAIVPIAPASPDRGVMDEIAAAIQSLAFAVVSIPPAPNQSVAIDRKLWLTLEEASAYSGFSETALRRAIAAGDLKAERKGPNGATIVQRVSLEGFAG